MPPPATSLPVTADNFVRAEPDLYFGNDPANARDVEQVHALQAAIKVAQASTGEFRVPHWDLASQQKVRDPFRALAATLPDTRRMFGEKDHVDPVRPRPEVAIPSRMLFISTSHLRRTTARQFTG